jgi:hypothetical protein
VIDALIKELSRRKSGDVGNALAALKADITAGKKAWLDEWSKHLSSDEIPHPSAQIQARPRGQCRDYHL